ncbi:hypothetical protein VNO78_28543 [Psophocarpus tetragonolobus]|uniref:Cation/H+ exchanger domain-containing protein n=1 Tax=Psophocarpus tetragonolobus TaxID=3891 RepID=A0AAN9S298_PSOTE
MNLNENESMFRTIRSVNESTQRYWVCIDASPHIVSDGLWSNGEANRNPMKSFLPLFELQVLLIFGVTQICGLLLTPFRLPPFISQMMAGLILQGCFMVEPVGTYLRKMFPYGTHDTISTISSIGFVLFIFINGVQMDFGLITRMGKKAWAIAIMGLVVPLLAAITTVSVSPQLVEDGEYYNFVVASVSHTVISFAVIASLLNHLEMQNSELGKLALSSALVSDVLCTMVTSTGTIFAEGGTREIITNLLSLSSMVIFVPLLCRPAMFWIIRRTPEGRPVKDAFIYLIILLLFFLSWLSIQINQESVLGAFILGLSVPEGPPLGSALVKKLNFFATTFLLPIFVTTCMLKADFSITFSSLSITTISLVVLLIHVIKIISCIIPALYCSMPFRDALSLALILNSKGVMEIGLYCYLYDNRIIDGLTYGIMMVSIVMVACIVQWSVKILYEPSRKYGGYQKRNIMSLKEGSELRMVVCIHKPKHISWMIDVVDLCCPTAENPIIVDALHLIELVGRALPILIHHRHQRHESGREHKSYSDDVILSFDIYQHEKAHAVWAHPCTAISPWSLMYEDVCNLAFDKVASIIILPFHQRWSMDGEVEWEEKSVRALNCRVLERAPCSVGILVTRSASSAHRLAVIYLGGDDDQEALCIAKRATRKDGMSLVVYHIVCQEAEEEHLHIQVELDSENDNIRYQQIIATRGSDTASFLSEIGKQHDFFIVGRRHGIRSPQTDGLTNWSEFPELGVIADFLSSPDLGTRASILVVQQQLSPKPPPSFFF